MLGTWYNDYKDFIESSLIKRLGKYFCDLPNINGSDQYKDALNYGISGGKRIRAILALEFYLIFSGKTLEQIKYDDDIITYCISLEVLHAYSLIHDDLPSMDNDDYRRGKQTVWKKYGQNTAILVGDAYNSLSFELLSSLSKEVNIQAILKVFGEAVGAKGMVFGQVLDLYYENNSDKLDENILKVIHEYKTGKLIQASILGGIIIGGKHEYLEKYKSFGLTLGLAFQLQDDLLDVEGSLQETGKSVGGEGKGYVHFLGLEKTKDILKQMILDCIDSIKELKSEKLIDLVQYIENRKK